MRNVKWAMIGMVVAIGTRAVSADPIYGPGGSSFDVPRIDRGTMPAPDPEPSDPDPGDDTPDRPPNGPAGPSSAQLRREAAAVERFTQGHRAVAQDKLDDAIGHFKAALSLGAGNAGAALANVQHRKATRLIKTGKHLEARRLLERAIANDPSNELYLRKRERLNEHWCDKNKPLVPHTHRYERDHFDWTATDIFRAKEVRARNEGWKCAWFEAADPF